MYLLHAGIEIACNLLDVAISSTEAVAAAVQEYADKHRIPIKKAYTTGKSPEELCSLATQALADQQENKENPVILHC
jgi:hypothetical protein